MVLTGEFQGFYARSERKGTENVSYLTPTSFCDASRLTRDALVTEIWRNNIFIWYTEYSYMKMYIRLLFIWISILVSHEGFFPLTEVSFGDD
jgi:hypothetical protein